MNDSLDLDALFAPGATPPADSLAGGGGTPQTPAGGATLPAGGTSDSAPGGTAQPPVGGQLPTQSPEFAALQTRFEELARENAELKARTPLPNAQGGVTTPQGSPEAPFGYYNGAPLTPERAREELSNAFIKDPGGTLIQAFALIQQMTQNAISRALLPRDSVLRGSGIEAFKGRMAAADPAMFASVSPEFDRLVEAELAQTPPDQLAARLDGIYSQAYGNVLRKRPADGRAQTPLPYGIGSGGGAANAGAGSGGGNGQSVKMTDEQRIYAQTMLDSMGDSPATREMIQKRLANWEE